MIQASKEAIEGFVDDVQSLWLQSLCSSIPVLEQPPTAMEFLRDFVAVNRPCLIRNLPHASLLTLDALVSRHADLEVAVDITPDGYGDCLRRVRLSPGATAGENVLCFVQPCQRTMSLRSFQQKLRQQAQRKGNCTMDSTDYRSRSFETLRASPTGEDTHRSGPEYEPDGVVYYSRQNDCLRTELAVLWEDELLQDVPRSFDWAAPALGTPTAINLWIGNECATSAMHKDYYDNLYYVASGEKVITLCPPSDIAFVYEQEYRSGSFAYCRNQNAWKVRLDNDQKVQWMGADVTLRETDPQHRRQFPLLQYTTPITVHVQTNEMIYIPALWLHRVTQSCETVAINYWYEMNFNTPLYAYFHLLQQMQPLRDDAIETVDEDGT